MLKFWGTITFGMKKILRKNRVVQGDRVIEGRVILIEGDYCNQNFAICKYFPGVDQCQIDSFEQPSLIVDVKSH